MARKRMIDPSIWQSEDFNKLSTLAKLIFIGLFSLADDEGRGRANPSYLKSTLFPYNEDMRSADIEKALSEISSNMSVVFFSYNGNYYYNLLSWHIFQKIDRPSDSHLPGFDENNKDIRRIFDECSTNARRGFGANRIEKNRIEKKIIEENIKPKKFVAPTLAEIEKYINEKGLKVNAKNFYDFFTEGKWIDSNGNEVRNWKQKLLTWNSYNKKNQEKVTNMNNYKQREYNNLNNLYTNKGRKN